MRCHLCSSCVSCGRVSAGIIFCISFFTWLNSLTIVSAQAVLPVAGGAVQLEGMVVDENHRPVENIRVQSYGPEADRGSETTDAEGRFSFAIQDPRKGYDHLLIARDTEGKLQGWLGFLGSRFPKPLEITLKPAHEVKVKVVDASDAPVAGAKVVALGGRSSFGLANAKTDSDGCATLRVPNDAIGYVAAFKSGAGFDYFTPQNAPLAMQFNPLPDEIALTLSGARTLRIKAIDSAKQPVAGMRMAVHSLRKSGQPIEIAINSFEPLSAVTDQTGRATFDWLPKDAIGVTQFECQSPDRTSYDPLTLADATTVEFVAQVYRKSKLTGQVLLPDGQPAPRVLVGAIGFHATGVTLTSAVTGSDGRYEMLLPSEQAYLIGVEDDHWAAPIHTGLILRENAPVEPVDFQLSAGTLVKGTLTQGADHKPASKSTVELVFSAGEVPAELGNPAPTGRHIAQMQFTRHLQTDEKGQYQCRIGPGKWLLRTPTNDESDDDQSKVELEIKDQPEIVKDFYFADLDRIRLTGKVLDAEGKPLVGAAVMVHCLGKTPNRMVMYPSLTDSEGKFKLERNKTPGLIAVRSGAMVLAYARLDDEQAEIIIHCPSLVQANGRLIDDQEEAVAGGVIRYSSSVMLDPTKSGLGLQLIGGIAKVGLDGKFKITGLIPGEPCEVYYGATERNIRKLTTVKPADVTHIDLGNVLIPQPAVLRIAFRLDADGKVGIFVNGERAADDDELTQRLPQIGINAGRRVVISADKNVDADSVLHVVQLLARFGMRNIELPNPYADFDFVVQRAASDNDPNIRSLPEQLGDRLAKVPGVKQVDKGLIDMMAMEQKPAIMLCGSPADSSFLARLRMMSGGRTLRPDSNHQAIIGRDLARKLDKKEGDEIELYGREKFTIVGVFFSRNPFENSILIIPLPELQRLMNRPGEVTGFTVTAERSIDADGLKQLRKRLAAVEAGLNVLPVATRKPEASPAETTDEKHEADEKHE